MTISAYPSASPISTSTLQLKKLNLCLQHTTLEPISAIHPHLLDILRITHPTLLLRISKAFYDDLIPKLYETLLLDKNNITGILKGIDLTALFDRKRDCLGLVKRLTISDIRVLGEILKVIHKDRSGSNTGNNLESGRILSKPVFPNLETLHLPFNLLKSLNDITITSNQISSIDNHEEEEDNDKKIQECSYVFSHLIRTKTIMLDFAEELDTDLYWSFDLTLLNLLEDIPKTNSSTKIWINTILPKDRPEKGYIPHNLSLKSEVHFQDHNDVNNDSLQKGRENENLNESKAKVIRDHYDVHTSRDKFPNINYYVDDVGGIKEELHKMVDLQIRVDEKLFLDQGDGGLLRLEE
ncbi:uncharacterized protein L201_001474 [Kwoniella dendrophila CBS 6074]|uniref:Uncharacterized protein n=1 Tax=Kwoniella dendrophila CBS 6074 TaxID=1295534 RepID=A0AAX4JMI9_9TREE